MSQRKTWRFQNLLRIYNTQCDLLYTVSLTQCEEEQEQATMVRYISQKYAKIQRIALNSAHILNILLFLLNTFCSKLVNTHFKVLGNTHDA